MANLMQEFVKLMGPWFNVPGHPEVSGTVEMYNESILETDDSPCDNIKFETVAFVGTFYGKGAEEGVKCENSDPSLIVGLWKIPQGLLTVLKEI